MIERQSVLMLPLMHHLVQQRLERAREPIAMAMPRTDRDLGTAAFDTWRSLRSLSRCSPRRADATPPPIEPPARFCISTIDGNTSDIAASEDSPSRPTT